MSPHACVLCGGEAVYLIEGKDASEQVPACGVHVHLVGFTQGRRIMTSNPETGTMTIGYNAQYLKPVDVVTLTIEVKP